MPGELQKQEQNSTFCATHLEGMYHDEKKSQCRTVRERFSAVPLLWLECGEVLSFWVPSRLPSSPWTAEKYNSLTQGGGGLALTSSGCLKTDLVRCRPPSVHRQELCLKLFTKQSAPFASLTTLMKIFSNWMRWKRQCFCVGFPYAFGLFLGTVLSCSITTASHHSRDNNNSPVSG